MNFISLVVCLLALILSTGSRAATDEVVKVKRGDLCIVLERDGRFIPADPAELKFWPDTYKGVLTIEEIVENGKAVKKGDMLLRLDKEPIQDLVHSKELDLKVARLKLEDSRAAFAVLGAEIKHARAVAEKNAKWAKKNREAYIKVEVPLEKWDPSMPSDIGSSAADVWKNRQGAII